MQHTARNMLGVNSIIVSNGIYKISQHAAHSTLGVNGPLGYFNQTSNYGGFAY